MGRAATTVAAAAAAGGLLALTAATTGAAAAAIPAAAAAGIGSRPAAAFVLPTPLTSRSSSSSSRFTAAGQGSSSGAFGRGPLHRRRPRQSGVAVLLQPAGGSGGRAGRGWSSRSRRSVFAVVVRTRRPTRGAAAPAGRRPGCILASRAPLLLLPPSIRGLLPASPLCTGVAWEIAVGLSR